MYMYIHSWATTKISAGLYGKKVSFTQDLKFLFIVTACTTSSV